MEHYLTYREVSQGKSQQTSVKYRLYLTRLLKFLEQVGAEPNTATHDDLETFTGLYIYKEMNMGASARRTVVAAVKGWYKWLYRKGHISKNIAEKVEYPRAPRAMPVPMPLDAAERLMWGPDLTTFTGVRDAAMFSLLIGCGLRISGLVGLNTHDLVWSMDDGEEVLSLRIIEKGEKERLVPVPTNARLLLRAYLGHHYLTTVDRRIDDSGNEVLFITTKNYKVSPEKRYGEAIRLTPRGFRYNMVRTGERVGVPRQYLHPHSLRHLFGAELAEDDVDVLDRMSIMGHSDVKSAEIYSHIAQRKHRKTMEKSSPIQKIGTPVSDLARILESKKR